MTTIETVQGLAAPVLVRTGVPGKPFAWVDPSPHRADENGHVWTFNVDEPCSARFCLLCCEEVDTESAGRRCGDAELIIVINECRARWIAENRVEESTS
jgi:hypothetical protein